MEGYLKEDRIVYISGYDRHLGYEDLKEFLQKYGKIINATQQTDMVKTYSNDL